MLRRTAFLAILATGLGLTAAGFHGLSGMDSSLKLAAAPSAPETAPVNDRWGECDGHRDPPPHRI